MIPTPLPVPVPQRPTPPLSHMDPSFLSECGNRYLAKNTIRLDEQAPDGPRADIAAIVLAACVADIVSSLLLQGRESLTIQGKKALCWIDMQPFYSPPCASSSVSLKWKTTPAPVLSLRNSSLPNAVQY